MEELLGEVKGEVVELLNSPYKNVAQLAETFLELS